MEDDRVRHARGAVGSCIMQIFVDFHVKIEKIGTEKFPPLAGLSPFRRLGPGPEVLEALPRVVGKPATPG